MKKFTMLSPHIVVQKMLLKPFDEYRLWRGRIQRSEWPLPGQKPPMNLPVIRTTLGGCNPPTEPIWDGITRSYADQSKKYWEGAKKRAAEYRASERLAAERRAAAYGELSSTYALKGYL